NLGFSAGHNLGIKESRGDLVFLLNQDIILEADFLKNAVAIFGKDKQIGAVQGKLLRLKIDGESLIKTQIIDNAGLVFLKNRRIIARGQGQRDSGKFSQPEEIFAIDGAAPIYRRAALEDIKICLDEKCEYLDEDFYMYKEDVDLAWRLRLAGWKAYYEPMAVAWHARTAGDSAATNYFDIIRERRKIGSFGKYHSFKNQRLMQIKNEQPAILLKHLPWFLPKEIASWAFVILFERYTWKAIKELFRQASKAWQKRKIIMAWKKAGNKEMERWFK
ncbi:glycosyltransferase, partial [Patescibacteria group bacterium]|nr:glycosyltransferase [Patescibacteria group bacterium]